MCNEKMDFTETFGVFCTNGKQDLEKTLRL